MKTSEEHFDGKVAQKAIIVKGDRVLITRDTRDLDTWELPGGRLNQGEDPSAGLEREVNEELGAKIIVGPMIYSEQFFHVREGKHALLLVYVARLADEAMSFTPDPLEIAELQWVGEKDFANVRLFPEYERAIRYYFENQSE